MTIELNELLTAETSEEIHQRPQTLANEPTLNMSLANPIAHAQPRQNRAINPSLQALGCSRDSGTLDGMQRHCSPAYEYVKHAILMDHAPFWVPSGVADDSDICS
ncbi:hypothetical protein DXG01_010994 [Tephrocybe rancida]|nr:hypothetical protein DXG01_010994 [Tephrocybe rancida]